MVHNKWNAYEIVFDEITKDLIQKTALRGHLHIECSHSLHQNDAKLQTHPPSTLNAKMLHLPKINVYNFRYKIGVGILIFQKIHKKTPEPDSLF